MLLVQGPHCKRPHGRNTGSVGLQRCLIKTLHSFPSYLELHLNMYISCRPLPPIPTMIQVLLSSLSSSPASCQTMATMFLEASSCIRTFAHAGPPTWGAFPPAFPLAGILSFLTSQLECHLFRESSSAPLEGWQPCSCSSCSFPS